MDAQGKRAVALNRAIRTIGKISNLVLSLCAGGASFAFTLLACLLLSEFDQQLVASLLIGLFALLVVWVASEKPNSRQARAISALIDRLMAVGTGDLSSPAPSALRDEMPTLASAVEGLFRQVRSNIDNVHAMAMYDPITSLPNRLHFRREAERILKARAADEQLALLFIDLDGFKEVNDNLGHAQGDQTLALVASRLRNVVRDEVAQGRLVHPLIARLAGDEFTVLLPSLSARSEAERIAQLLLDSLCATFEIGDQTVELGASIGVAFSPDDARDLTGLMKAADLAMYSAKANGRSNVRIYEPSLAVAFEERTRVERALRQAVARREFDLAFQPLVSVRNGSIVAGEALVRWNHPAKGTILPESFIAIAEESWLIVQMGNWVMEEAARTLASWQAADMAQRLTINISPRQLERADFFSHLRTTFEAAGAPLFMLELEFTETLAMRCSEEVVAQLAALRADGVSIAIDDFGAGYSNLARMKTMPLTRVKLDSSLIADIDSCETSRTIVASVIHLIHGLGAEVVGEGVERREQLDVLRSLGCDMVQGYLFAEPMGEPEFRQWLSENSDSRRLAKSA
jgi:diguanylate cyclase (GGDEF)-like protein